MDLGRKPVARFQHEEAVLSQDAVSHELLETVISQVLARCAAAAGCLCSAALLCSRSRHACFETLRAQST